LLKTNIELKNKKGILTRLASKRHWNNVKRKNTKRKNHESKRIEKYASNFNIAEVKYRLLSDSLKYIADCEKTEILEPSFNNHNKFKKVKSLKVPIVFSLVDNPNESYTFIKNVINTIYHNKAKELRLDYSNTTIVHIGAQLYLDILLRDIFTYSKKLSNKQPNLSLLNKVRSINVKNENVEKLLHSIGSFAIHMNTNKTYEDIVPYKLCEFKKNDSSSTLFNIETKERDVTDLVQYVIDSLEKINKELTDDSIENLSIIIGEILINAEEHSTNQHRFSIGYFQSNNGEEETGIFNLVILNFGKTIYDKFKDKDCPRKDIVKQMEDLSEKYTSKRLFGETIKEETLWTLYALQEEITSVSPQKNIKRGNGSIKFIESFFSLKGENGNLDSVSRLAILSGNTSIVFDGTYGIKETTKVEDKFKVMTFNESGNISDKPDANYVKFVKNHFPGTIISAQILISKDDLL
jgi:hypothetical protein